MNITQEPCGAGSLWARNGAPLRAMPEPATTGGPPVAGVMTQGAHAGA
jgi:hypothetical protein